MFLIARFADIPVDKAGLMNKMGEIKMTEQSNFEILADELQEFFADPTKQIEYIDKWRIRLLKSSETKADKIKMAKVLDQWQKQTEQ